jgi:hypothetical protein
MSYSLTKDNLATVAQMFDAIDIKKRHVGNGSIMSDSTNTVASGDNDTDTPNTSFSFGSDHNIDNDDETGSVINTGKYEDIEWLPDFASCYSISGELLSPFFSNVV